MFIINLRNISLYSLNRVVTKGTDCVAKLGMNCYIQLHTRRSLKVKKRQRYVTLSTTRGRISIASSSGRFTPGKDPGIYLIKTLGLDILEQTKNLYRCLDWNPGIPGSSQC
jgi:hypothetical protein